MKTYIAKRNFRSDKEAIKLISERYGFPKVIEIGNDYILEEFVEFKNIYPSLNQMSSLLKNIHSEKNLNKEPLVHGDFGAHNTILVNGEVKCFDYEYSHFGNVYADIGRVLLRGCKNVDDVYSFFNTYSNSIPDIEELKEGLIYFCNWQHDLRKEKELQYQKVPLIRASRILNSDNNLENIIKAFKEEVSIK